MTRKLTQHDFYYIKKIVQLYIIHIKKEKFFQ